MPKVYSPVIEARWHIKFKSCVSTLLIRVPQVYQLASRYIVDSMNLGQGTKEYAILVSGHMIKSLAAKYAINQNYWPQKSLAVHYTGISLRLLNSLVLLYNQL